LIGLVLVWFGLVLGALVDVMVGLLGLGCVWFF
jgi:hypothetical protein